MFTARCTTADQGRALDARQVSGRSVSGMCGDAWSTANSANTALGAAAIAPISVFAYTVFADTKPHAQRPKEASR